MDDFIELLQAEKNEVDMKKELENDIIPKNSNLVRRKNIRKKTRVVKENIVNLEPMKPKVLVYEGTIEPLKDTKSFMLYYRMFIEQCVNDKVVYDGYGSDSIFATDILDKMIENNKSNMSFLNAWLKWFCDNKLKGNKISNIKYTSMKVFKDTFVDFVSSYYNI